MQRHHMGTWIKYAEWEASIDEYVRSRSVFERAMEIDYQHVTLWLKYVEMEMRNKNIDHARNIWDRACKHMPRVDQFWYKYAHMEEMIGNFDKVREIFENWLTWEPKENAWDAYIKFEERNGDDVEKCRDILMRYIDVFQEPVSYMKAAKYEEKHRNFLKARLIYERALAELGSDALDESFLMQFIKFEIKHKKFDRAKVLFEYSLEKLPDTNKKRILNLFVDFQKQFGSREDMECIVLQKRRTQIENDLLNDQYNYDLWFDYTRLEEQSNDIDFEKVRDVYERAISNKPLIQEKIHWRRYIYLWINYAIFEEQVAKDVERAKMIYEKTLQIIPHESSFTFSKVWILLAQFHLRKEDLVAARKLLGQALGKCPRRKLFRYYIQLEM